MDFELNKTTISGILGIIWMIISIVFYLRLRTWYGILSAIVSLLFLIGITWYIF